MVVLLRCSQQRIGRIAWLERDLCGESFLIFHAGKRRKQQTLRDLDVPSVMVRGLLQVMAPDWDQQSQVAEAHQHE